MLLHFSVPPSSLIFIFPFLSYLIPWSFFVSFLYSLLFSFSCSNYFPLILLSFLSLTNIFPCSPVTLSPSLALLPLSFLFSLFSFFLPYLPIPPYLHFPSFIVSSLSLPFLSVSLRIFLVLLYSFLTFPFFLTYTFLPSSYSLSLPSLPLRDPHSEHPLRCPRRLTVMALRCLVRPSVYCLSHPSGDELQVQPVQRSGNT